MSSQNTRSREKKFVGKFAEKSYKMGEKSIDLSEKEM